MTKIKFLLLATALLLSSCIYAELITIRGQNNLKLKEVEFAEIRNWRADNHKEALKSFLNSCEKFASMDKNALIGKSIGKIRVRDFIEVCNIGRKIQNTNSAQIRNFFENWFRPFLVMNKYNEYYGSFTGYYEPELRGSWTKTGKYQYPIYAKPKDLTDRPYLSRKQINEGALANKGLELLYVDDKADLFFLHIQGSGHISMNDGSEVKISFAGKNNQPYSSIGKYLKENFNDPSLRVSSTGIKEWLRENPKKADDVMNVNKSYIFFQVSRDSSVRGAQGVKLTAERSLAVDSKIIPYGLPIWLDTFEVNKNHTKKPFQKLMVTQDTGSAIKGIVRGDIFFGFGENAEKRASTMHHKGKYYILLPVAAVQRF